MHMLLVIAGGILMLGLFLLFGRLWGGEAVNYAMAGTWFLPTWLAIAVANLWVGVSKAGYTVNEELLILLLVFAVPAAVAVVFVWQVARS